MAAVDAGPGAYRRLVPDDTEPTADALVVRRAPWGELTADTAYGILALRSEVFVVEQRCAYQDLDGRDLEPDAEHWWIEEHGVVASYLRVLHDPDGTTRLGRVVTRSEHRSRGLSDRLIRAALESAPRPVLIHAQAHLARWYRRFGFEIVGDVFLEDGIDHLPMRLG